MLSGWFCLTKRIPELISTQLIIAGNNNKSRGVWSNEHVQEKLGFIYILFKMWTQRSGFDDFNNLDIIRIVFLLLWFIKNWRRGSRKKKKTCSESGDQIWMSFLIQRINQTHNNHSGRGWMDRWMDFWCTPDRWAWAQSHHSMSSRRVVVSYKLVTSSHSFLWHSVRLPWWIARRVETFLRSEAK